MRIGLVGYGTGGKNFHAPYIEAAADCELVGIVARAPATVARAQADWPEMPIFDSLGKMIDSGVDAVTISTPPATRDSCRCRQALRAHCRGSARAGQRGRGRRRAGECLSQPALGR